MQKDSYQDYRSHDDPLARLIGVRTYTTEGPLKRIVYGKLKEQIDAHGPITEEWLGSTTKRIVHQIRGTARQWLDQEDRVAESSEPQGRGGNHSANGRGDVKTREKHVGSGENG